MYDVFSIIVESVLISLTFIFSYITEFCKSVWRFIFPTYKSLSDDVVLITGAGSGIGRLMCIEFSKFCPTLVAWDINEISLKETAKILAEKGCTLRTYLCDMSKKEEIIQTAEAVLREVGRVTVVVNNAGVVNGQSLVDLKSEDFERCLKVNYTSHFYTIKAFLPRMIGGKVSEQSDTGLIEEPRGHIVSIASIAAVIPLAGLGDYCASKAAGILLSESLELEMMHLKLEEKIHLTRIYPFFMNTKMFKGCKTKQSWLFPIVDAEYAARRIVQAVRANEKDVFIYPRYLALPLIKWLCPHLTTIKMYETSGNQLFAEQLKEGRAAP